MRIITLFLTLCLSMPLMAQKYYIKTYDPHNLENEEILDMCLQGENIVFRGRRTDSNQNISTIMGKFSIVKDSMIQIAKLDDVQFGLSLLKVDDDYLLSSYEDNKLRNISVSVVDSNLKLKKTLDYKLSQSRYFKYIIREAIQFGNKSVVSVIVSDTLNQYNWKGEMQCREKLALFVLDKQLKLDTAFLITPNSNNYWMEIQGLGVGSDSTVYVSIYERGATFERKAIYGYNKQFKKVYTWVGPEINDNNPARSSLAIGNDGTVYTAYYQSNSRTYLYAIDKYGKQKWACPFDSTKIKGGWGDFSLAIAKNGDILGSATISSAMNDLGNCAYLFRINPQGKMLWNKVLRLNKGFDTYSGTNKFGLSLLPFALVELPNGDIATGGRLLNFLGKNSPNGPYNTDLFIARVDSTGCLWKNCPYIQDVVQKPKYLPIVTARNEWVSNNPYVISGGSEPFNTTRTTFTSDSFLLDNKYYFKLRSNKSLFNIWETGNIYIREKNGIVYFRKDANTAENILYNFNLSIGDTLPAIGTPKGIRIVEKVSTVIYADGIPRKMMTYVKPCRSVIVEGIGDLGSPFYSFADCALFYEPSIETRCFSTDGKLIYKVLGIQGCFTVAVKDVDVRLKSIYPNPTTGLLNIDTEDTQAIKSVTIVDNLGRIIQMDDFEAADNGIQLNISNLQNGLYFGKVVFSDGSKTGFKIIKVGE